MTDEFEKKEQLGSDTASDESTFYKKPEKEFVIDMSGITEGIPDYNPNEDKAEFEFKRRKDIETVKIINKGSGCFTTAVYTVVVLLISVLIAAFVLIIMNDMMGLIKKDEDITITVSENATFSEVADMLQDMEIIDTALGLKVYAELSGKSDIELKVGEIVVNPKMGYSSLLNALKKSNVKEIVKVTIIEGKTIKQIAEELEKNDVCSSEDFIKEIENGDYSSYDFLKNLPENDDRIYNLEGYIFPDTYEFYKNDSAENVIKKFLNNFDKRFSKELRNAAEESGMSIDEVITLASIVQKESSTRKIMNKVASVFINRLDKPSAYPYLQSNATLTYITGKSVTWFTDEDLDVDSPYNSYKYKGLPPGAVCNPGLNAIEAVLYCEKTDYYYFVSDEEGLYYFSETFKAHQKQIAAIKETGSGIEGTAA